MTLGRVATVSLFVCYVLGISLLGLEIVLNFYHWIKTGETILFRPLNPSTERPVQPSLRDTRQKLSPYFGYTLRPGWILSQNADLAQHQETMGYTTVPDYWDWPANNYGFQSNLDYPYQANAEDFVIGIFGGSVANGLALEARDGLTRIIRAIPGYENRNVVIINLAHGGFKQPQQVILLSYFLSLGQKFNLIINMDGLNEAYIGWDNVERFQADPTMPSAQFLYGLQNHFLSANSGSSVAVFSAQSRRAQLQAKMNSTRSALLYYIYLAQQHALKTDEVNLEAEIGRRVEGRNYPLLVQKAHPTSIENLSQQIAETWYRGSLLMKAMADSIGASYVHILQPNQYVGRHRFSNRERKAAFSDPPWIGIPIVRATYPKMKAWAGALNAHGVHFIDATTAFDKYADVLYFDACCHFNRRGYQILVNDVLAPLVRTLVKPD